MLTRIQLWDTSRAQSLCDLHAGAAKSCNWSTHSEMDSDPRGGVALVRQGQDSGKSLGRWIEEVQRLKGASSSPRQLTQSVGGMAIPPTAQR